MSARPKSCMYNRLPFGVLSAFFSGQFASRNKESIDLHRWYPYQWLNCREAPSNTGQGGLTMVVWGWTSLSVSSCPLGLSTWAISLTRLDSTLPCQGESASYPGSRECRWDKIIFLNHQLLMQTCPRSWLPFTDCRNEVDLGKWATESFWSC